MKTLSPSESTEPDESSRSYCGCSPYAILILDIPSSLSFTSMLKKLSAASAGIRIVRADSINRNIMLQIPIQDLLGLIGFVKEHKLAGHAEFKMICTMKTREEKTVLKLLDRLAEDRDSKSIRRIGKITRYYFIFDDVLGCIDYKQRNKQIHLRLSFLDVLGVRKDAIKLKLLFREELPASLFFVTQLDDILLVNKILTRITSISSLVENTICH